MSKIQIQSRECFAGDKWTLIVSVLENKKYVVPAWKEVPMSTTWDDIEVVPDKEVVPVVPSRREVEVVGSKGNVYKVVVDTELGNSCSCVGYTYHRTCKHIKSVLSV